MKVELTALHDVSFTIGRGEICVIVGESGAGKSMTMYCLTALLFYLIGFTATVPIIIFILTFIMSKQTEPDMPTKKRAIRALIFARDEGEDRRRDQRVRPRLVDGDDRRHVERIHQTL